MSTLTLTFPAGAPSSTTAFSVHHHAVEDRTRRLFESGLVPVVVSLYLAYEETCAQAGVPVWEVS